MDLPLDDKVWVPHPVNVWELADVVSVSQDKASITVEMGDDDDGSLQQKTFPISETLTFDKDHEKDLDNVFELGAMNAAGLMELLRRRAIQDNIYTFIGDILISVNPYAEIKGLYEPIPSNLDRKIPHAYAVADKAYQDMLANGLKGKSQSILINGESGAGKTEAAKRIMSFLADRSQTKRKEVAGKSRMMGMMRGKGAAMGGALRGSIRLPGLFGKRGNAQNKRSSAPRKETSDSSAQPRDVSQMEDTILHTNPILEAFGNARTIRNDNSSRFGKFVQLEYSKDGVITGAKTLHFLLEKSRLVSHARGERNYHIFYQLCAAAQADPASFVGLELAPAEHYRYLSPKQDGATTSDRSPWSKIHANTKPVPEGQDFEAFENVTDSFDTLGLEQEEKLDIWRVLAAILALGNVSFKKTRTKDGDEVCKVAIGDNEDYNNLELTARLLGVDAEELVEVFSKRSVRAGRRHSVSFVPLTVPEAEASRDGLAKAMYQALFEWLVRRLNVATSHASGNEGFSGARVPSLKTKAPPQQLYIGILDIFGFEILECNSFEQLCINYTNEVLQGMFDDHVFQLELDSLAAENIHCPTLAFRDNKSLLSLLDSKPSGIFQLLDEQGALGARGSDAGFLQALKATHSNDSQPRLRLSRRAKTTFQVIHFAGPVTYESVGLVSKNADHLQPDLMELITKANPHLESLASGKGTRRATLLAFRTKHKQNKSSSSLSSQDGQGSQNVVQQLSNPLGFVFLQKILVTSPSNNAKAPDDNFIPGKVKARGNNVSQDGGSPSEHGARKMAKLESVSSRFRKQMSNLQSHLESTMLHFVRCIKPNERKQQHLWDASMVSTQLRMLGILEMVRVRHEGFPVRMAFGDVLARYPELLHAAKIPWKTGDGNDRQVLVQLLMETFGSKSKGSDWQMGDTKCFMLDSTLKVLDHKVRIKREESASALQLLARRRKARALLKKKREAADRIAAVYRGSKERRKFLRVKAGLTKIQAHARTRVQVANFASARAAATKLASFARMRRAIRVLKGIKSVIKVQAHVRGLIIRVRWERLAKTRQLFSALLRPNESVVHVSTVIRSRRFFSKVGHTYYLVFTTGPTPRILLVTQDYLLREEIPWLGNKTSALASSKRKLVIHSDMPVEAVDLIKHEGKSASAISRILQASKLKIKGQKKKSVERISGSENIRRFTFVSNDDNAFAWLLMIQEPYTLTQLLALSAPHTVRPLSSENPWAFGGPGVAGGNDTVHLEGEIEWTQRKSEWRHRYFVLKGTSLYWFESKDCNDLPLGGVNLSEQCTVKKSAESKKHRYGVDLECPLFSDPLHLSFETERIRKHWVTELRSATKRRADGFKRHTLSRGFMNSQSWRPVEEALSMDDVPDLDQPVSPQEKRPSEDFEVSDTE